MTAEPDTEAADPARRGRRLMRVAQLSLVVAGLCLWAASRMPWVEIRSFDGLGQPKTVVLTGSSWSTALVPLVLLLLAAAVAALAVRGWPLRLLAVIVAAVSAGTAYLAISQWVVRDIAVRGADLAQVPITALVGSGRHYWGAGLTLAAAMCALVSAFALMRCASAGRGATAKYVAPAARRAAAQRDESATAMSERMIWDALDEGTDPTERPAPSAQSALPESDTEGR